MTIVDEFRQNEVRVLDRLVDNELGQADRAELLSALDDEPGAWRRCALAFLEAQAWRWQLGRMAAEPLVAHSSQAGGSVPSALQSGSRFKPWPWAMATAAGLFLAFALGTRFSTTTTPVADLPPSTQAPSTTAEGALAKADSAPKQAPPEAPADPRTSPATAHEPLGVASTNQQGSPSWQTLTLAEADASGQVDPDSKFQVRVRDLAEGQVDGQVDLEKLLAGESSALPAALVDQLEQEGWKVTRERQLLPVTLSDGRQVVLPVEQVDLHRPQSVQF